MKPIGLKFLLQGGQFFIAVMAEAKATEIIKKWLEGTYKLNGPRIIGVVSQEGTWGIDTEMIVGMHTMPVEQQLPPFQGGSGFVPRN